MQDSIGPVIAKALSQVYKEKPKNPVDFFAKTLLQQNAIQKTVKAEAELEQKITALKEKQAWEQ